MRRCDCKALAGHGEPVALPAGLLPRLCTLLVVLALWLVGGCSGPILSFPADADGIESAAGPLSTGSIVKPPSFGKDLGAEDWRRAHAALSVALDPQGNGKAVKWDNPETGMRGSISPVGLPYVARDEVCRDFVASIESGKASRTLRGTGCKASGSSFEVKSLKLARA